MPIPYASGQQGSHALRLLCAGLLLAAWGCSRLSPSPKPAPMGERVSVGSVTYNVFQADWRSDLETSSGWRYPRHRFLVVRLSITNGAGENVNIPLLRVEDASGKTYMEEDSAEGVEGWLGLLRIIPPAHTDEGTILFDVPPGNYKLHVVDGGDLEQQKVRLVEIPYTIAAPVQVKPPAD